MTAVDACMDIGQDYVYASSVTVTSRLTGCICLLLRVHKHEVSRIIAHDVALDKQNMQ